MHIVIDVVFVDRKLRVVGLRPRVRPWRIAICWRAHSVIEFGDGAIEELKIAVGDQLSIEPNVA
jgi:uncharacterized membrane protein (UPF0127 family)